MELIDFIIPTVLVVGALAIHATRKFFELF
jgi:hypothetical protein